jgi:leucyl/phenylalanyl-tRNA--protein transferase
MLARLMKQLGNSLIDCQFETPHLKTMGGRYIDYDEYLKLIRQKSGE